MDDIKELYQQIILDHNKNPKNYGELENYNRTSEGYNPLCGDRLNIYLQIEDDRIKDIHFVASGCAISKASASVMTTELKGKTIEQAKEMFRKFQKLLTSEDKIVPDFDEYGKMAVFAGVREFPTRVKCAILGWHTVLAAIEDKNELVTTE
jgi:nitrogen fixation protein NifU and related proteins